MVYKNLGGTELCSKKLQVKLKTESGNTMKKHSHQNAMCVGDHAQDRYFSSRKMALEFLSNNANKGYNVMMPCKGTGIL
jgi:hypothetical protein|nr:MAG TPA: hypothetical protein [Caudoviricetes sp.]